MLNQSCLIFLHTMGYSSLMSSPEWVTFAVSMDTRNLAEVVNVCTNTARMKAQPNGSSIDKILNDAGNHLLRVNLGSNGSLLNLG